MGMTGSPGIRIVEKKGAPGPIQGVSPSALALVGFTLRGLTDQPILCTSPTEFEDNFGSFTGKSLTPTEAFAFFQNGGNRLYVVRVTAIDAVKGSCALTNAVAAEDTGVTAVAGQSIYTIQLAKFPVKPTSLTLTCDDVVFTDAAGVLTGVGGAGGTGSINYDTGEINVSFVTPGDFDEGNAMAAYTYETFEFEMLWPGVEGDNFRVYVEGSADWRVSAQAKFTKFKISVEEEVGTTWVVREVFDGVDFTSPTGDSFIVPIINDPETGSKILKCTAVGNNEAPVVLAGTAKTSVALTNAPSYNGTAKAFVYSYTSQPAYPKTLAMSFQFKEIALKIGRGTGTATPPVVTPTFVGTTDLISKGDGTLAGAKVTVSLTLTVGGVKTGYDDGAGKITADGTTVGTKYGTISYDTGLMTIDVTAATDTVKTGTDITVNWIYAKSVVVTDVGSTDTLGVMAITSTTGPEQRFQLNDSGTNQILYSTGAVTLTWKIIGDPALGPAGDAAQTCDFYTTPSEYVDPQMASGADGSATSRAVISDPTLVGDNKGLYALNKNDDMMNVVIADFQTDKTVTGDLLDYCELRKDRFAIITPPDGMSELEEVNWKQSLGRFSTFGAIYSPHIRITDPVTNKSINVPCGGHVAGRYAATDAARNVAKAPAGTSDGALKFLTGLAQVRTPGQVGVMTDNKINANVDWPQTGRCIWGASLMSQVGDEFEFVPQRRLFMYVEKSLFNSTHWAVFEPNNATLWSRIYFQVDAFIGGLFDGGYLAGTSRSEGYFVICDATNNNQNWSTVYCDIGLATLKPSVYIVFTLQQKTIAQAA